MEVIVQWDSEDADFCNARKIQEKHHLTQDEVEAVLGEADNYGANSRSSGRPMAFGWTPGGRFICVVYVEIASDPFEVYPITAYDVPPGNRRR